MIRMAKKTLAVMQRGCVRAGVTVLMFATATSLAAQASGQPAPQQQIGQDAWRLTAAIGAWSPRNALILAADNRHTRLGAGTAASLDVQYEWMSTLSLYGQGMAAFSTLDGGSSIASAAAGPSNQVTVLGATGGLVLAGPWWLRVQPTLRIGGGMKGYMFDLDGAETQWRPTGDFGIGFRGTGSGPIEMMAEVRYFTSSFDQAKFPTRGITAQIQRQNDLMLTVGVTVRP